MRKKSAIEMMNFNPFLGPLLDSDDPRPAENKRIKERFESYLSIGFYRDLDQPADSQIRYYLYEDRYKPTHEIKTYSNLIELKNALQSDTEKKDIFRNHPKVFIVGHGGDDRYGVGGDHLAREAYKHHSEFQDIYNDPSEQIHGHHFDKIINDLRDAIFPKPGELFITLEVCNSDNLSLGKRLWNHDKTFLKSLSESHQDIIFSGSGPWDLSHNVDAVETGTRAPGGINTPITSMTGNIWKSGNTVVFYHNFTIDRDISNYQVVVKKTKFASTETAKELKVNMINCAAHILENAALSLTAKKRMLKEISENPAVLTINDLKIISDFPCKNAEVKFVTNENQIIKKEKDNYIANIEAILKKGNDVNHRDVLEIALVLKDFSDNDSDIKGSIFEGNEKLLHEILSNKKLLGLVMVACGKVLIATSSNNKLIDLLKSHEVSVNTVDEFGMSALHYAVQNFYIYRDEPLNLIKKLLDCGANCQLENQNRETPYAIAMKHANKEIIMGREKLMALMQTRLSMSASANHFHLFGKSSAQDGVRSISNGKATSALLLD